MSTGWLKWCFNIYLLIWFQQLINHSNVIWIQFSVGFGRRGVESLQQKAMKVIRENLKVVKKMKTWALIQIHYPNPERKMQQQHYHHQQQLTETRRVSTQNPPFSLMPCSPISIKRSTIHSPTFKSRLLYLRMMLRNQRRMLTMMTMIHKKEKSIFFTAWM